MLEGAKVKETSLNSIIFRSPGSYGDLKAVREVDTCGETSKEYEIQ